MSELREWQKPLTPEKIAWLSDKFRQLRLIYIDQGYIPAATRHNWWEVVSAQVRSLP